MKFSTDIDKDGIKLTLAGQWQDLAAYYRGDDGSAWIYSACTRGWSNAGSYEDFIARFSKGFYRGQLLPA